MHLVHSAQGRTAASRPETVFHDVVEDQCGVVVPALGAFGELVGVREELADAGYGVGAVQRQPQGLSHVPGELLGGEDACDLLTVVLGVQCVDSVAQLEPLHEEKLQSPSCRPGETGPRSAGDVSVLGHDASRGELYPEGLHVQKVRTEWVCRGAQT